MFFHSGIPDLILMSTGVGATLKLGGSYTSSFLSSAILECLGDSGEIKRLYLIVSGTKTTSVVIFSDIMSHFVS
jgi:hypothetical protein